MPKIAVIGGSGLDNPEILQGSEEKQVSTKYGAPSSSLKIGKINGVDVVLLSRHGRQHTIPPSQVNFRANIQALKDEGCTHILASTAVGSLREKIGRGDFVILDQFIDFTRHRFVSFCESFEPHKPEHTPMAEPFSKELREKLIQSCEELNLKHHKTGIVITIEGPRFSTKAESNMFRIWGADVINMSIAPETALANEAGIPYAAVAMSTDYDCWKEDEAPVTWEEVLKVFEQNAENMISLLVTTIPKISSANSNKNEQPKTEDKIPDAVQSPIKSSDLEKIKSKIRTVPNWPKPGIQFRDITTLLKDKEGFETLFELLTNRYKNMQLDAIVGIESRGFIIGSVLADRLGLGFVPIRKKGKLPAETISEEYHLEYGTDTMEIHKDAITPRSKVLLVDDLIATGGTALAACNLIKKVGAGIVECAFIIDLPDLGGKKRLKNAGHNTFHLIEFEGE